MSDLPKSIRLRSTMLPSPLPLPPLPLMTWTSGA